MALTGSEDGVGDETHLNDINPLSSDEADSSEDEGQVAAKTLQPAPAENDEAIIAAAEIAGVPPP